MQIVQSSRVTNYKSFTHVNQSDFQFVIPGEAVTYVNLYIYLPVRGKLVAQDDFSLDPTENTTVVINLPGLRHLKRRLGLLPQLQGLHRNITHLRERRGRDSSNRRVLLPRPWGRYSPQPAQ